MKTNRIILILTLVVSALGFNGCSPEDDIQIPTFRPVLLNEDFNNAGPDETILALAGWTNFAEVGTVKWSAQTFGSGSSVKKYAEFTGYQSGQAVTIGWLISPALDLDKQAGEKLAFDASKNQVTSTENSFEVLISTDFDGTNVTAATWTPLSGANIPSISLSNFAYVHSLVDLSAYSGKAHIAFKVKGSGTNTDLDGGYQIDNVKVFN